MKTREFRIDIMGWVLCIIVILSLFFVIIKDQKVEKKHNQEIQQHIDSLEGEQYLKEEKKKKIIDNLINKMKFDNLACWEGGYRVEDEEFSLAGFMRPEMSKRIRGMMLEEFGEDYLNRDIAIPSPEIFEISVDDESMQGMFTDDVNMEAIPIIFFNNTSDIQYNEVEAESYVSDLERLVNRYADEKEDEEHNDVDNRKYIVVCFSEEESALDNILNNRFGNHYMRSDILEEQISEDSYSELAVRIIDKLDKQGYFEDVKREIESASKEFQKL